jgi:hypothetical protein
MARVSLSTEALDLAVLSQNLPPGDPWPFTWNVFFGWSPASLWKGTFRLKDSSTGLPIGCNPTNLCPAVLPSPKSSRCPSVGRAFSAKLCE